MRPNLWFDGRSAAGTRLSGWERCTRELAAGLAHQPCVHVSKPSSSSLLRRLAADVTQPLCVRRFTHAHYPSFPPTSAVRPDVLLYTLHDLTWWKYPSTASTLGRHYYRPLAEGAVQRAVVLTTSETVASEIKNYFALPDHRVIAVPLGSDLWRLPADDARPARDRPYLLSVASVEPRKNLDRLVAAYQLSGLKQTHDLVLVGRQAWGTPPGGVQVLSGVSDRALASLYRGATATVLMSLYEGYGLPLIESLSAGTPVVCSDIPVFREVVGPHASYADPFNVAAIAAAMQTMPDASRIERATVDTFRAKSWSATVEATLDAYRVVGAL